MKTSTCQHLIIIFLLLLSGCATQKQWQYSSERESTNRVLIDKTVAIPPLIDQRSPENSNKLLMYMLPIMPFGWQELNVPEGFQGHVTSAAWLWKPNEDLAKATAEEISKSHLFKDAFFTNRASDGELILEGEIKSTKYNGKILSYGLSVYGPMLWFIGLPAGTFSNELILDFKLKEINSSITLWSKQYKNSISNTAWLYHMPSDFEYSDMLKKTLLQVVKDIQSNAGMINGKLRATP